MRGLDGFRVHHRALTDNFRELCTVLLVDRKRCARWSDEVGVDLADRETLAGLMLKAALIENPESVVLFSSKSAAHMRRNVAVAEDATLEAPARKLYGVVQAAARGLRAIEAGG